MLLLAMTLGVIILVVLGNRLRVAYRTPLSGCAHDIGTGGAAGVYRWADRLGIPVRLLDVPIWEAPSALGTPEGNCVLTMGDGSWVPGHAEPATDPEQWMNTGDWLSRGNALIIVTTTRRSLPERLQQSFNLSALHETAAEPAPLLEQGSVRSRPETSEAPVTTGGFLTVEAKGPRWNAPPIPVPAPGASRTKPAPAAAKTNDPARWQLAGDSRGGVLYRFPVGRGAVYVLLDEFAWTNTGLDQGENARVLSDILGREIRGGVLAFDENRHGHGRSESFLTYLVALPGSSAVIWLAAIWALLYFYGHNVRLRPAEAYIERERRTAQEYIDAVAQLYERARAAPLVVAAVARRLRQVARVRAGCPRPVEALLASADRYVDSQDRPAAPSAAIHLTRGLIQLRKQIYGSRTVS